jgi:hypothetical protein
MLVAGILLVGWQIQTRQTSYTVSADSKMWVEGTSSLHDWTCYATEINGSIDLDAAENNVPAVTRAQVTIPIGTMDCHNGTMDGKLKKALKEKDNPNLLFELDAVTVPTSAPADSFEVATAGYMMIAGQTRKIEISQFMTRVDDEKFIFRGSFPISMKDYSVKPPTALLGTIRTGNDVTVFYELVLEVDGTSS